MSKPEGAVWFDDMAAMWICEECGSTLAEDVIGEPAPTLDFHWRPRCSQPRVAPQ